MKETNLKELTEEQLKDVNGGALHVKDECSKKPSPDCLDRVIYEVVK